jgi:hypothetical protein
MSGDDCHALYESLETEQDLNAQLKAVEAILNRHNLCYSLEVFRNEVSTEVNTEVNRRTTIQIVMKILPVDRSALHKTIATKTNYDAVRRFGYRGYGEEDDTSVVPEFNKSYGHVQGFFTFWIHNGRRDGKLRFHFLQDGCIGRAISNILDMDETLDQLKIDVRRFLESALSFYMRQPRKNRDKTLGRDID